VTVTIAILVDGNDYNRLLQITISVILR